MSIQIKRFSWVQRPSTWEYAQAWKSHRSAMVQSFLGDASAASSSFLDAQWNFSTGMASLAAQASIQRAQQQISDAQKQFSDTRNAVNLLT
jgi:hypothetical protein